MTTRKRVVQIAICMNLSLWLWFWGWFFAISRPFPQRIGALEDRPPHNVVLFREAGSEGTLEPRTVVLVSSLPSWLLARAVGRRAWAAEYRTSIVPYRTSDAPKTYAGTSIGGYVLIGTTVLSFFQWYGLALLFALIRSRFAA